MMYREDLDAHTCDVPGCTSDHDHTPLYFRSRCHPGAGTWAVYEKETVSLRIICLRCDRMVAEVAVASRPDVLGVDVWRN